MKGTILVAFIIILSSCSPKTKSKSGFKITLGKLAVANSGGVYVNFMDLTTFASNIVKLDSENSSVVTSGIYDLLVVGFAGPNIKTGTMLCGLIRNANLTAAEVTFTISVSSAECLKAVYKQTILNLKKEITSKWDEELFDLSHWGP